MANRIQLRRDGAQNWASNNPVLFEGELGFETDTRKIKIGINSQGSNLNWNDLLYANVTPEELAAAVPSAVQNFSIDQNGNLVANNSNGIYLIAQSGPIQISSYNSDVILSPDGWAYLYNNQSSANRIATESMLYNKADLDSNGQVPISQLGNALGGASAPIHPFAMLG